MIYPTLRIELHKPDGYDLYGQPKFRIFKTEMVSPVQLRFQVDKSTVRTDSSGSKGHAQEPKAQVVVLARDNTRIEIDDKLIIHKNALRVVETHPRYTVTGVLDHIEVHAVAWV